ncbi:MAG: methylated-DNA--[protein]-cysteine S-methyltransferase [Candidatus Omnitrophica bacterium]|nr:methylated-DNA--[protein]-cysteine S-methyltransferase [Candidatus Omnitrophota bacterium]
MKKAGYVIHLKSCLGMIGVGYRENAVVCLHIGPSAQEKTDETLQILGYEIQRESHPTGVILKSELREYFEGKRRTFSIPPQFYGTPFQIHVWKTLCRVPYGKTLSYGELAARSGRPKAARAVGMIMGRNRIPIIVPCHRILAADGSLGGFGCGLDVKKKLLQVEGSLAV